MIIKKTLIAVSVCAVITGCAHKVELLDTVINLNQPHRVIEHNFNQKYDLVFEPEQASLPAFSGPEPKPVDVQQKAVKEVVEPEHVEPLAYVDIDFFNESAAVKNRAEVIDKIKKSIDTDRFLIVGHSHGKSAIGVESLASKRARYLSNLLYLSGIPRENIIYISSWSDGGQPYDIPKGARIIGLPKNIDENIALLTGLIIKKDKL